MTRLRLSILIILCDVFFFGAGQVAEAQSAPSVKLMLGSWKSWAAAFRRDIHSYNLHGKNHTTLQGVFVDGKKSVDYEWSATKDGNRFLFRTEMAGKLTASYDGTQWYYLIDQGAHVQHQLLTESPQMGGHPLLAPFRQFQTYPFTTEEFLDVPWIINASQTGPIIPLYDHYLTLSRHITMAGQETVNGRVCYHIHFDARFRPKRTRLPEDVWLTTQGQYFIPWQLRDRSDNWRGSIILTEGAIYKGLWYPTGYLYRLEMIDRKGVWKAYDEDKRTFPITEINQSFPVTAFQIKAPVGAEKMVNDHFVETSVTAVATPVNRTTVIRYTLLALMLGSAILFVWSFRRRKIQQA